MHVVMGNDYLGDTPVSRRAVMAWRAEERGPHRVGLVG